MPTVPRRVWFWDSWTDAVSGVAYKKGMETNVEDQRLLDDILAANVATLSAAFDPANPGEIGASAPAKGTFTDLVVGAVALLAAGSAAAPALANSADTDTGVFFPAANEVALAAGGSARLVATAAGVAIGSPPPTPLAALHVHSGATNQVAYFQSSDPTVTFSMVDNTTTTSGNGPLILSRNGNHTGIWAGGSERISILSTGAVGMGTTSPGASLHLVSNGSLPFIAQGASSTVRFSMGNVSAPSGKRFFGFGITSGSALTFQSLTDASTFARNLFGMNHDGGLTFYNASSAAAGVWDASNVRLGLGTTSPRGALDVNTGDPQNIYFGDNTDGVRLGHAGVVSYLSIGGMSANGARGLFEYDRQTGNLYYSEGIAGSEDTFLTVLSNGKFGFGTTAPAASVHIAGNARIGGVDADSVGVGLVSTGSSTYAAGVQVRNYDAAGWARVDFYHTSASAAALIYQTSSGALYFRNDASTSVPFLWNIAGSTAMVLTPTGFGLGTTSPDVKFHVHTTGNTSAKLSSSFAGGFAAMTFDTAGDNSIGRFIFSKSGVTGGGIKYDHATGGASQYIGFNVAGGSDKLTLTGAGRLGVVNTAPAHAVHVGDGTVGGVAVAIQATDLGTSALYLGKASNAVASGILMSHASGSMDFRINSSVVMSVRAGGGGFFSGDVGFGTTSPISRLHVRDDGAAPLTVQREADGQFINLDGNGYAGFINLDATGLGIGHNSASRSIYFQTAGVTRFSISASGRINMASLPTSSSGLSAGDLWNDGGVVKIV